MPLCIKALEKLLYKNIKDYINFSDPAKMIDTAADLIQKSEIIDTYALKNGSKKLQMS